MAHPLVVGIPSNRPERLKPCLLNVFDALQAEGIQADVFVCDGSGHARQNQEFATQAAARYSITVSVMDEKSHQAKQSPDTQFLFDGPFGGPRNAILQHAVRKRADTVFLDDDVVPSEGLFSRFQKHLNQHRIVVGAYALAYHGAPRFTGDLDLYVKPCEENARRIVSALTDFGFGSLGLGIEDFTTPGKVVQLGVPPVRVDLITSITGVSWEEAVAGHAAGTYGDLPVPYLGKAELMRNKRALGRKKDLADLEALGED